MSGAATGGGARPVFVAGYSLASTLGGDLATAVRRLASDGIPEAALRDLVPGERWPHFALAEAGEGAPWSESWRESAQHRIKQVMNDCGALGDRSAPLFIASSSINVGGVESGEARGADCLAFSERVASWLDWSGPVFWLSTACTSAINALRSAQALIERGDADSAVVLGLELPNRFSAAGFAGMQLLSPDGAQPLAANRNGLVLGEAVTAIRLTAGVPIPQGVSIPQGFPPVTTCKNLDPAPPRWRVRGGANVIDGRDPAGASRTAVAAMVQQVLAEAALAAEEVDLIKLQAAGSPHNDAAEIAGLRQVFAPLPALCTLKPLLGHTLGAAGAAELALLLACLEAGVWPPQRRADADPELAVRLAELRPPRLRYLLLVILGFGGGHAALLLEDTLAVAA